MNLSTHQPHPQPLPYSHTGTPGCCPLGRCNTELHKHTLVLNLHALSMLSPLPESSSTLPLSHCIHSALLILLRHHSSDPPDVCNHSFFHTNLRLSVQNFCIARIIVIISAHAFLSQQTTGSLKSLNMFYSSLFTQISVDIDRNQYTPPQNMILWHKDCFFLIYINLFYVFIFGCTGSSQLHGLSQVAASGGYSSLQCAVFSLQWLLLLQSMRSLHASFSSCGTQAQQLWLAGSRVQAQQLWCTGLVAPRHVRSSQTRARTRVPCIGRWILNHLNCATREAQGLF